MSDLSTFFVISQAPAGPTTTGPSASPPAAATQGSGAVEVMGVPGGGQPATGTATTGGAPAGPAGAAGPIGPGGPVQSSPLGGMGLFVPMLALIVLMIFMSVMSGRKEKKRRAELMAGMSKHDRVQTTAGIIGTIVEMGDNDLVLRVDETSNTRIRFAKAAIVSILPKPGASASGTAAGSQAEGKPAAMAKAGA